jgi:hypothetical protein
VARLVAGQQAEELRHNRVALMQAAAQLLVHQEAGEFCRLGGGGDGGEGRAVRDAGAS